jgi:hypothetical protein
VLSIPIASCEPGYALRDAVCEIFLFGVAARVGEWQAMDGLSNNAGRAGSLSSNLDASGAAGFAWEAWSTSSKYTRIYTRIGSAKAGTRGGAM